MKILHSLDASCDLPDRSVVTIGNFDGIHRGHRKILQTAATWAKSEGAPLVVVTFQPHPLEILAPGKAPPTLSNRQIKLERIASAGADQTVVLESTSELLSLEPEAFISELIVARLHPAVIVEGHDFHFGRKRAGNVDTLRQLAGRFGFKVDVVAPVLQKLPDGSEARVSSSLVRSLLSQGRVEVAADALGRSYAVTGVVSRGSHRGHELGFPTANILVEKQMIPADGVYAGSTVIDNQPYGCAVSIGSTPTFDGESRQLEAHVLDFKGDLYGRSMTVSFERWLRSQRKFESREALIEQIQSDVASARSQHAPILPK